jgi:AcrR family transcriptional regulator
LEIGKRRLKEKKNRISEIQKAAHKIFFKKGFQGATLDDIAKAAGISKATIYLYFCNKEDLYVSLMGSVSQELGKLLEKLEIKIESNIFKSHREIIKEFFIKFMNLIRRA